MYVCIYVYIIYVYFHVMYKICKSMTEINFITLLQGIKGMKGKHLVINFVSNFQRVNANEDVLLRH